MVVRRWTENPINLVRFQDLPVVVVRAIAAPSL